MYIEFLTPCISGFSFILCRTAMTKVPQATLLTKQSNIKFLMYHVNEILTTNEKL